MVLLRVELENNDEKIKFETHGILNKNKNTLIYDDNKTKTCVDLIAQKASFTLEFKRIKLNKTDKLFEVEYIVDNTNKIYYRVEIINL
ncbi:unknown [Clostridium sp. CAG:710]|nr:unknown [Clostridium sp. CAG:710]